MPTELLPLSEIIRHLWHILGLRLTAYIASVDDTRKVWDAGHEVEPQLRLAHKVAALIAQFESPAVVQAWITGLNPELNDRVPIQLLREGTEADGQEVLNAAMAYITCGHNGLPLTSQLTGSDPDFTGNLSTDDYIRSIRREP